MNNRIRRFGAFLVFMEEREPLSMFFFVMGFYFIGLFMGWWQ